MSLSEHLAQPMKDLGDYITYNEAERMVSTADSIRNKSIIGLLWRCGLRTFEITRVKVRHLVLDDGVLVVEEGKGKKSARVPVEPELLGWLKELTVGKGPEDYIIEGYGSDTTAHGIAGMNRSTIWRIVEKVSKEANVPVTSSNRPTHPHCLRHSLAIWLVQKGVPIAKVSQILRHSSLASTTCYLQFNIKELAADYLAAWEDAKKNEKV